MELTTYLEGLYIHLLTSSKRSPTGPSEPTPKKPEYLIARLQLTERGPLVRSQSIFDGLWLMHVNIFNMLIVAFPI